MADYYPPSENLPTFDVTVFRSTNDNVITQDDGDRLYLSRQGTASSLATSTSFLGSVSCGGNLTLTAPVASNRQIEGSFLKLVDNASTSSNKPLIWYPDPSLQITTNDVVGAVKTIDFKSFNGAGTGISTSLTCQYGQVQAQGTIKLTRNIDASRFSTITQGATELTIANTYSGASPHINLNTPSTGTGLIITNSPLKLTTRTDDTIFSTITQGATELTIANTYTGASPNINLNTPSAGTGLIVTNTPLKLTTRTDDTIFSTITQGATELTIANTYTGANPNINLNTPSTGTGLIVTNTPLKLTERTDQTKYSTITQGALDLTIANPTFGGSIIINPDIATFFTKPIVPPDNEPPSLYPAPSIGYTYFGSVGPTTISSSIITLNSPTQIHTGTYIMQATVKINKATSVFADTGATSYTKLTYNLGSVNVDWRCTNETRISEIQYASNRLPGSEVRGNSAVVTYSSTRTFGCDVETSWVSYGGTPTATLYWTATRIA